MEERRREKVERTVDEKEGESRGKGGVREVEGRGKGGVREVEGRGKGIWKEGGVYSQTNLYIYSRLAWILNQKLTFNLGIIILREMNSVASNTA